MPMLSNANANAKQCIMLSNANAKQCWAMHMHGNANVKQC